MGTKTEDISSQKPQINAWWHGVAALPADRTDHAYHVLRRVWGDHTMAGNRGFYRTGCEDHVTVALFQNWALFPEMNWVAPLVRAAGGQAGNVSRVRWAYACEELIDARLQPFHRRNFIIPDIMLHYEDEAGPALLVFEVKPPTKAAEAQDARKLESYIDLPSTRKIARRFGCLLVGERTAERTRQACGSNWPILTWERLKDLQLTAARNMGLPAATTDHVIRWIDRQFARYGIQPNVSGAPISFNGKYGTQASYRELDALSMPDSVRRFLKGSECIEAAWTGRQPHPPLPWLVDEPNAEDVRQNGWQTTEDRRVCRWNFDWSLSNERNWVKT